MRPSASQGNVRIDAPTTTAWLAASCWMECEPAPAMISPPRGTWAIRLTRLPIVPLATKSAGLLARQLGGALLERDDGRVVAEDVVAELRLGHRAAHLGRGLGDRVGAQVDPSRGHRGRSIGRSGRMVGCAAQPATIRRHADPWCSGPTCQPVTLEIAGSNPVGSAILPNAGPRRGPPRAGVPRCARRAA